MIDKISAELGDVKVAAYYATRRTASRCRAAVAIALILATALALGTWINAQSPSGFTIQLDKDQPTARVMPPSSRSNAL